MQRTSSTEEDTPVQQTTCHRITSVTSIAAQISLGLVGLGAGAMYVGPASRCAEAISCGKWLADLTSRNVAIGVFISGGANFAGINAYFSAQSINQFIAFERKQTSVIAHLGWGGVIMLFTASQNLSTLLSTVSTSTAPWQTILTVAASTPNSLYSAVNTAENEIPMIASYLSRLYRPFHYAISDLCLTPSMEELIYRQRAIHYRKEQAAFLNKLDEHWYYVKTHPYQRPTTSGATPLSFLFSSNAEKKPGGCIRAGIGGIDTLAALIMTAIISWPFMLNNFGTIEPYIPDPYTRGILTTYFSYSFVYSNLKLLRNFAEGFTAIFDRLTTGRPINSLLNQLHPYLTMLMVCGIITVSSLSYALMNVIFEMEYPEQSKVREGFRYTANVGIILYHIAGMFQLCNLLFSRFTPSKHDQFLFNCDAQVAEFHKLTSNEFITFAESNPDERNEEFGIQRFQPVTTVANAESGLRLFSCCKKKKNLAIPEPATEETALIPKGP